MDFTFPFVQKLYEYVVVKYVPKLKKKKSCWSDKICDNELKCSFGTEMFDAIAMGLYLQWVNECSYNLSMMIVHYDQRWIDDAYVTV